VVPERRTVKEKKKKKKKEKEGGEGTIYGLPIRDTDVQKNSRGKSFRRASYLVSYHVVVLTWKRM